MSNAQVLDLKKSIGQVSLLTCQEIVDRLRTMVPTMTAKDLTFAHGIIADKVPMLLGEPTAIVEHRSVKDAPRLAEFIEVLPCQSEDAPSLVDESLQNLNLRSATKDKVLLS